MKKFLLLMFLISAPTVIWSQIMEVANINPTGDSSPEDIFVDSNNRLFFAADNGTDGNELYVYDGSSPLLIDINNAEADANSNPNNFTEFEGKIYFRAFEAATGTEFYETDGTVANTMLSADINDGASSNPNPIFVFNGELYFTALDGSSTQIWRLNNGSPIKVTNNNSGGFAGHAYPHIISTGVYMRMNDGNGNEPAFFDGTGDAVEIKDIRPGTGAGMLVSTDSENIELLGDKLFFEADPDDGTGDEIWITDGTEAGTFMLKDTNPGEGNGDPDYFEVYNGEMFFASEDANGYQLWKSDGTVAGTILVADTNPTGDGSVSNLFSDGTNLYFAADNGSDGVELWKYNGTTAEMLKDINSTGNSSPSSFVSLNGLVYFSADDGSGAKLWQTDGTSEGTVSVASNFTSTVDPVDVELITIWDSKLVFVGTGTNGNELFSYDPSTLSDSENVINTIRIYPNPTASYLMVPDQLVGSSFSILDMLGRSVMKGTITTRKIDLKLDGGTYVFKSDSGLIKVSKKIVVK